jgi:hypothetical protein
MWQFDVQSIEHLVVGQYATQRNFPDRWLPRGVSHLRVTETPQKRQSNHIFRPAFRTCCRAPWFAALNQRYGPSAPRRCISPIPVPQTGISNVSTPWEGEAPAEPQTQPTAEHLSEAPAACQPTTAPCPQLIAIRNYPAKQLRRSPSTGSGSSPAIRGLSGIWAHCPTASSQSPRGCAVDGGASLRVTGHWGGACSRAGGSFQFSVFSFQLSVFSFQFSVVSCQLSVVSCQLSVVSCQLSVVSCQL